MRTGVAILGAGWVLAAALRASAADDRTFDIKLERPFAAGQVFTVSSTGTSRVSQKTETPDGQVNQSNSFRRIILNAEVRIEKVDGDAQPAALAIKINKLTLQSAAAGRETAEPAEIVRGGITIAATYDEKGPSFSSKDLATIPNDAVSILGREFRRTPLRDEVFGTREKKKPGDKWPVNTTAMKVDVTEPSALDPRGFVGNVELKPPRQTLGTECVSLEAILKTNHIPSLVAPPTEAAVTVTYSIFLPVDATKPIIAHSMKTVTHVVMEQKPLGRGVIRTTSDSEVVHEATWVRK
jgi:hypothetical protein